MECENPHLQQTMQIHSQNSANTAGLQVAQRMNETDPAKLYQSLQAHSLSELLNTAQSLRTSQFNTLTTYSPKVFIPLTKLCRDVCHYCTFAAHPKPGQRAYMSKDEVLQIATAGAEAGCKEALFTLGDKPELRYQVARDELESLGYNSTVAYLKECAQLVVSETGLLPHLNPGVLSASELDELRKVSVSMGLMLESSSDRLCEKGMPHYGSPDKKPSLRLDTIELAGKKKIPFTTGLLIGIGETRVERIDALLKIRQLHRQYGHIQEVIVQNFRAKLDTKMRNAPEPTHEDLLWTVAAARLILDPDISLQVPPNLSSQQFPELLTAGINDWGGISPVTPDHVNPEAPWPQIRRLREHTQAAGLQLTPRLPIYPQFTAKLQDWVDESLHSSVLALSDAHGLAREDTWHAGDIDSEVPAYISNRTSRPASQLTHLLEKAVSTELLTPTEIEQLFSARGSDAEAVFSAADTLRKQTNGNTLSYVINRNINYTNVCYFHCSFCAFSKGRPQSDGREKPYLLPLEEIQKRTLEAQERGATEVCLQGGIHPDFDGKYYLSVVQAVKEVAPAMHIHAFSPLEIWHGAETLKVEIGPYLETLRNAGLRTLPGTSAEILDDTVRSRICPDKNTTEQWLHVMREAHQVGLKSTATIMFGHIETPKHWAKHLTAIRDLQIETGGFTEFVPLPFVHMEAPMARRGWSRTGPTFRETLLMHAVARLTLHPWIENIQTSWVKMGVEGVSQMLQAGANDIGGTLMNESISRAAGSGFGQELTVETVERLGQELGRVSTQRDTLYNSLPSALSRI